MKQNFLLGFSFMILISCNDAAVEPTPHDENQSQSEHHQADLAEPLELNNGDKWIVNEEMKPFVAKGEELVNTYIQNKESDNITLAKQLEDQNNQLIKSCTMTGKSHDELHKWLYPHLEIVKSLKAETDPSKASEHVLQLQNSYRVYHQYFN